MARTKKTKRASATDAINATIDKHEAKTKRPRKLTANAVREHVAAADDSTGGRLYATQARIDKLDIGAVYVAEYKLAVTVVCPSCSADIGEMCVEKTNGSRPPRERQFACTDRALVARQAAPREVAPKDEGGRAERNLQGGAAVADVRGRLPDGCGVWMSWPGARERAGGGLCEHRYDRPAKRASLVRYDANGLPVVRVFAMDAHGVYTGEMDASERTLEPNELIGPMGANTVAGALEYERANRENVLALAPRPPGVIVDADRYVEPVDNREMPADGPSPNHTLDEQPAKRTRKAKTTQPELVFIRCWKSGCEAEYEEGKMPPDWRLVHNASTGTGVKPHCPVHAREVLIFPSSGYAPKAAGGASFGPMPSWMYEDGTKLDAHETAQLSKFCLSRNRWPGDAQELRAWMLEHGIEWSRPATPPANTTPPVVVEPAAKGPSRGLNAPVAIMCAHRDDAGRCVKSFHGIDAPRGWVRVDSPADVMKSAFFCTQHKHSPCRDDIYFCPAEGCDAFAFGSYAMPGWTKIDTAGRIEMRCPRHGLARDAAAVAAQPPRIGAPPMPQSAVGTKGSPHHRDTRGSCGACDASFAKGMPPKWEWWRGNFWCPDHIPVELREPAVPPAAGDPWDEPSTPSVHAAATEERMPWE